MPRSDPEARRAYHREYMKKWYVENSETHKAAVKRTRPLRIQANRERLNLLRNGPCTDCGVQYPQVCMEWDHLEGKEKEISRMISSSWKKIEEELKKCELVCCNCHRIRTARRAGWCN